MQGHPKMEVYAPQLLSWHCPKETLLMATALEIPTVYLHDRTAHHFVTIQSHNRQWPKRIGVSVDPPVVITNDWRRPSEERHLTSRKLSPCTLGRRISILAPDNIPRASWKRSIWSPQIGIIAENMNIGYLRNSFMKPLKTKRENSYHHDCIMVRNMQGERFSGTYYIGHENEYQLVYYWTEVFHAYQIWDVITIKNAKCSFAIPFSGNILSWMHRYMTYATLCE